MTELIAVPVLQPVANALSGVWPLASLVRISVPLSPLVIPCRSPWHP